MTGEPFFVVWCEGGGVPTVRHATYSSAKSEAQRLARQVRGSRFTVMVAVSGFEINDLTETEYLGAHCSIHDRDLEAEIPF